MGMYGSAPEAPDPKETAAAQTSTNVGTAVANSYLGNINQVTPDGNLTYSQSGTYKWSDPTTGKSYDIPTFTATQSLSPTQNAIKKQEDGASLNLATLANSQSGRLNQLLGKGIDLSSAPQASNPSKLSLPDYTEFTSGPKLQTSYDVNIDTSKYEQALMDRLNPQLQQDSSALEAKLVNQGLQPGSEAYNRAFAQQGQKENDARIAAILNAGQEQTRLANLAKDQATFGNTALQQMYTNKTGATAGNNALADQTFNADLTKNNAMDAARSQYLQEQYAKRNQGLNEITSLMSGAQVTNPNFVSTQGQTMPTVDYAGLVNQDYQNKLAAYQQSQAGIGSLLGGVGSLFALSDKRAKKDIKKVGKLKGMNLYEYGYKGKNDDGKRHVGVMAQEAEKKKPSAVRTGADGYKRVNYGALFAAGGK